MGVNMSKRTVKEIIAPFKSTGEDIVRREDAITWRAGLHCASHLDDSSINDSQCEIAGKVLDFLRNLEADEKVKGKDCLALTIMAVKMGMCCWINDTMSDASEKAMFEHHKN
jgi:enhancing lycopene biosynthesis protein 2